MARGRVNLPVELQTLLAGDWERVLGQAMLGREDRQDIASVKDELHREIEMEAERRCCGDNAIVTYANATFYPKQVADVTTGTATTTQTLYNPLPKCGCCNK